MTLKNNRAPLLYYFKLCASFDSHLLIQNGVTVRKHQIWVKIGDFLSCVTLTFDLWTWPFAWISLLSLVITPENFMMIRWWEHSEKGVTDGQTDGRMERSVLRAAWSQLKIYIFWTSKYSCAEQNFVTITRLWFGLKQNISTKLKLLGGIPWWHANTYIYCPFTTFIETLWKILLPLEDSPKRGPVIWSFDIFVLISHSKGTILNS